ncbi:PGAP1-domain-containing protein, partial [Sistotremastrum suecicum HHB10207 ss-3]
MTTRRYSLRLAFVTLLAVLFTAWTYRATVDSVKTLSPQGCRMSYMYPEYILQKEFNSTWTPLANRYSLWLYREGDGWDTARQLTGNPVLFIPGNAGSSHQVRSIASSATTQYFATRGGIISPEFRSRGLKPLDFYTAEFNEDFSALHEPTLDSQRTYIHAAITYILSLYPPGTSVILLGHSMGGIVATSLLPDARIAAIITMSTPHALPPARYSSEIDAFYQRTSQALAEEGLTTPIWSLCGGATDLMIPSETCRFPANVTTPNRHTVFTSALEGCWSGVGHQESVWCHQVRWRIARAALELGKAVSDAERSHIISKWLRHDVVPDTADRHSPSDTKWQVSDGKHPFTSNALPRGPSAHLLPILPSHRSFILLASRAKVFDNGPPEGTFLDIEVFRCRGSDQNPQCSESQPSRFMLVPNPGYGAEFPAPKQGVDESDGVLAYELSFQDAKLDDGDEFIGLVLNQRYVDERSWVVADFSQGSAIDSSVTLLSILTKRATLTVASNELLTKIRFPNLPEHALLVYRLDVLLDENCKDSLMVPLVAHDSEDETHFHSTTHGTVLLHSHSVGPFLPEDRSSSTGLSLSIYSSGQCQVQSLTIALDLYSSLGRVGSRYFGAVAVWGISIVALLISRSLRAQQRTGAFPTLLDSLSHLCRFQLHLLCGVLLLVSMIPLPEMFLLGNKGMLVLSILSPLIVIVSTGFVHLLCIILNFLVTAGVIILSRFIGPKEEISTIRRSLIHIGVVMALVKTVIPYQVVFVICFLIQLWTCIIGRKRLDDTGEDRSKPPDAVREPESRKETEIRSPDHSEMDVYNQNMHLLLLLSWLLPNMAPALAVWVRTMATAHSVTLFNSDHSVSPIIVFVALVEFSSHTRQGWHLQGTAGLR